MFEVRNEAKLELEYWNNYKLAIEGEGLARARPYGLFW